MTTEQSLIFPALTPSHVDHLAWAVDTFGEAYIHGSGDIFTENYPDPEHKNFKVTAEENSNNAYNKASEGFAHSARKRYRKLYKKGDKLPTTVLEIEADLQNAYKTEKQKNITANQFVRETPVFTPKVEVTEEVAEEKKN